MKAVILAGGYGTRLSEETGVKPKPMVNIGEMPILWHIMKIYSTYDINDFIICLGYKGYMIKEFFSSYLLKKSNVTFDLHKNNMKVHQNNTEPWRVTLIDTGEGSMTGGRLKRVKKYIDMDEAFCLTYGDGVGDIDITATIEFHRKHQKKATLTATVPPGRFGALKIDNDMVSEFKEKPIGDGGLINGGFFVLSPAVLDLIEGDSTIWEQYPLKKLSRDGDLMAYVHEGFWQPMDTLRDKHYLESLWAKGEAPWKVW